MASATLDASFHNTTDVDSFRAGSEILRPDNFLYYDTHNSAYLHLLPSKDATMTPGTLAPLPQDSADTPADTILYLFGLSDILTPEQIAGLRFDDAWQSRLYRDDKHGQYWAFTPKAGITLRAHTPYRLDIGEIVTGREGALAPTATLNVSYWKVPDITGTGATSSKESHAKVEMRRRPEAPPLANVNDLFACRCLRGHEENYGGYEQLEVITLTRPDRDTVANRFTLEINNKIGHPTTATGASTKLLISFPAAEGAFGALASTADLQNIQVTRGEGAESWTITPVMDATTPYWQITIPVGQPISGLLQIDNVISRLEPGMAEIAVQFNDTPGCQPGHVVVPLLKYTEPYLISGRAGLYAGLNDPDQYFVQWTAVSLNPIRIRIYYVTPDFERIVGSDFDSTGDYWAIDDWSGSGWLQLPFVFVGFSTLGVFTGKDTYTEFGRAQRDWAGHTTGIGSSL
jgi:hypothetical protein